MPFDGTEFRGEREPPRRVPNNDNAITFIIVALAFCLLATPISISGFMDIAHYLLR